MKKTVNSEGKNRPFACEALPAGYELYKRIDLTKDRNSLVAISIWSLTAALAMVLPMLFVHNIKDAFAMPVGKVILCAAAMVAGMAVYLFLHEWAHGLFIRLFTGSGASFDFDIRRGMASASSRWYFRKVPYIIIALAPLIIWGTALAVLLGDVEETYFWYLYGIQVFNVSGAAGDLYVVCAAARMPENILILDSGAAMDFYAETKL